MGPPQLLRIALLATSLVVIGLGGALLYSGSDVGWFLIGFGILDLLTMPLVLRTITRGRQGSETRPSDPSAPIDPAADPSYNPYARED
jgi:hypothetical protein